MNLMTNWLSEASQWTSLALIIDIAVKATILILLAMLFLRMRPRASAALRHRVWCLVFCGLVALPALCFLLPGWAVPILPSWYQETTPVAVNGPVKTTEDVDSPADEAAPQSPRSLIDNATYQEADTAVDTMLEPRDDQPVEASQISAVPDRAAIAAPPEQAESSWPTSALNPVAIWLMGAALCLLPLIAGLVRSAALRAKARNILDTSWIELRDQLCFRLDLKRAAKLLEVDAPIIPLSCGVVRPAVVLPHSANEWNERLRRFVLLHELSHIKRHDVVFQLIARLACALYWFHPLVWYALYRLRVERELACDDSVLAAGERPSDYAEQLLEVARRLQPLRLHAAVAMAQSNKLEHRVSLLFSRARSHLPLSTWTSRLLLACAIGIVIAVSVVRPSARATDEEKPVTKPQTAATQNPPVESEKAIPSQITGRVISHDGKPVAGASVFVLWIKGEPNRRVAKMQLLYEIATDSQGRFKTPFPAEPERVAFNLFATAPGHGLSWDFGQDARAGKECVLKLAPDDAPIEGRVLDLEGQPIAGVQVTVRSVTASADDIDEWIKNARNNPAQPPSIEATYSFYNGPSKDRIATFPVQEFIRLDHPKLGGTTTTDAAGRFRLTGLGDKRLVHLELSGAGVAKAWLNAVTHPMDAVPYPQFDPRYRFTKCFGSRFDVSLEPEQRITGVVRDAATRQPLAGMEVRLETFARFAVGDDQFAFDFTDAEGRYELNGIPRPGEGRAALMLRVIPSADQPYFRTEIDVSRATGLQAIDRDIELKRALWIRGRVIDERTGKPAKGEVAYYPFLSNATAKDYANFDPGVQGIGDHYHYATAADGSFRIPGLPGRGIVTFIADDDAHYPRAQGADAIGGMRRQRSSEPRHVYYLYSADLVNAVQEINPPAGVEEFTCDVKLKSFTPHKIRLLDSNGQPVTGVVVEGVTRISRWGRTFDHTPQLSEIVDIFGLSEDEPRHVRFTHRERGLAAFARLSVSDFAGNAPKDVTLLPAASIVGRIVDQHAGPTGGAYAFAHLDVDGEDESSGFLGRWRHSIGNIVKADGRLIIENVPPGVKYSLQAHHSATDRGATLEIEPLKPGERLDLGDITLTPPNAQADGPFPQPRQISFADRFPSKGEASKGSDAIMQVEKAPPKANEAKNGKTRPSPSGSARPAGSKSEATILRSRVVGPDGKPVAGAEVMVLRKNLPAHVRAWQDVGKNHAKTNEDGTFEITLKDGATALDEFIVTAEANGFGMGWNVAIRGSATPPIELRRLVAIDGRIVDLEGRPIKGVTVSVDTVVIPEHGVNAWLDAVQKGTNPARAVPSLGKWIADSPHNYPEAKTDADGRFRIDSIGAEQQVKLSFRGPSVAFESVYLVTRPLDPIVWKYSDGKERLYGLQFTHVAAPSRPIRGVVRDAATADAIAGVEVRDRGWAGSTLRGARAMRSTTNAEGRFEIHSIPVGEGKALLLVPNDQQPYFIRAVDVPPGQGLDSVEMSAELHRGLWITGRVLDKSTRKPVAGARVHYLPFFHNQHAQALPEFDRGGNAHGASIQDRYITDENGAFRLPGLPGPAVVGVDGSDEVKFYRRGVGFEEIAKQYGKEEETGWLKTWRDPLSPSAKWPLSMTIIDPQVGADEVRVDFELDPGLTVSAEIVDPNSDPVAGVAVGGRSAASMRDTVGPQFDIINLGPDESRTVLLQHEVRQLGKVVRVTPAEHSQKRLRIQLEPLATITGRLVDNDGNPVATAQVSTDILPSGDFSLGLPLVTTDSDGQFRVENVPAGCVYRLLISAGTASRRWYISKVVLVEPGQTTHVGLLSPKTGYDDTPANPRTSTAERRQSTTPARPEKDVVAAVDSPATLKGQQTSVRGQIVASDGRPAAGAPVAAIARRVVVDRGADLTPSGDVLAEATADEMGRYELRLPGTAAKTHRDAYLLARSSDSALAWRKLNLDGAGLEESFELKPGDVLKGRLVDLEGQPAAAVKLRVSAIRPAVVENRLLPGGIDFWRSTAAPAAWAGPVISDTEGRFSITGVPKGHGVYLTVEGNDRFAVQDIALNTGVAQRRGKSDATYRPQVKNGEPNEEVVLTLAPANIFTGRVTYEDTGEPAPDAPVQIWASQQTVGGSMISVGGRADADGHFRLNPYAGVRFGLTAYAPLGAPYLTRRADEIVWDSGARTREVNIKLPRGVLVNGTVLDEVTGRAVAGASVQYVPESANNPHERDDLVTGWQGMEVSDERGRFEIVVLPGRGRLLVHDSGGRYVLRETSNGELYFGKPGGRRNYAHGVERVDPPPKSQPLDVTIRLQPGGTATGELVDNQGHAVDAALMVTRLHVRTDTIGWRGSPQEVLGGRFEQGGLAVGKEYAVHFLEPKRQLGATVMLKARHERTRVTLHNCGEATMRFVDSDGKPIADHDPHVQLVVSSGPLDWNRDARESETLSADADFVANVDRLNYGTLKGNDEGRVKLPAMIPGATYRVLTVRKEQLIIAKEFQAKAGETIDLGDIVYERGDK